MINGCSLEFSDAPSGTDTFCRVHMVLFLLYIEIFHTSYTKYKSFSMSAWKFFKIGNKGIVKKG